MKKERFHYAISGYRWAPESFRASKWLDGHPRKNIPLTLEERCEVGRLFLTKGFQEAKAYIKHIERAREHSRKRVFTYGFFTNELSNGYMYCPRIYFHAGASIDERLCVFKRIRAVIDEAGGRVVVSTECELDGAYRPMNIKENTVTANFSRPLCITIGDRFIRSIPERPYHPRSSSPKKARSRKQRNKAPER